MSSKTLYKATLAINGTTGVLTLGAETFDLAGESWGHVMAAANRIVEQHGRFVQMWQHDLHAKGGGNNWFTSLGTNPSFFD